MGRDTIEDHVLLWGRYDARRACPLCTTGGDRANYLT